MHPYHHALSSVKKHGGCVDDYLPIHNWFDESKQYIADFRHRAMRHHSEGIFWCEQAFGVTITNSAGKEIPVRVLGEQHVREDLGQIPSIKDWYSCIKGAPWMNRPDRSIIQENKKKEVHSGQ
jgi:hypothetical protein